MRWVEASSENPTQEGLSDRRASPEPPACGLYRDGAIPQSTQGTRQCDLRSPLQSPRTLFIGNLSGVQSPPAINTLILIEPFLQI